jgi:hypothetical protein
MEGLSKELIIQQVEAHRDRIRDATDRLSEIIHNARKTLLKESELDDESTLAVRKVVHEIVSEISSIGGFCDKWTRDYIVRLDQAVAYMTSVRIYYPFALQLEYWAVMVNSIIVDYTKTPFRLSELKPIFSVLKEALRKKQGKL